MCCLHQKVTIEYCAIFLSYACPHKGTVVVKGQDALVAVVTVLCSQRLNRMTDDARTHFGMANKGSDKLWLTLHCSPLFDRILTDQPAWHLFLIRRNDYMEVLSISWLHQTLSYIFELHRQEHAYGQGSEDPIADDYWLHQ